ncbi:MAG TPA: Ig-like domain-containing protein, partial [Candidatus Scatomorpha gallistercoris]|nr:Ig-like domain-containing protein [Candidatus Scatomorpha gallistercoris]
SGTVYGNVTLQEDLEIGTDETLTIGKDASLTVPDGKTLTNNGTVTTEEGGTLTGNITNAPPKITTTSLSEGTVNTAYNQLLAADNNPTSWSVTNGALPNGLTLENGTISGTPTAAGASTFTVKAENTAGSDSKELTLTINPAPVLVNSVTLNKSELALYTGGSATLTATVQPEDATNKAVNWSSSDEAVATVDTNGKVTAKAAGEATITATAADGSGKSATCEVTVKPAEYTVTVLTDGKGSASASATTAAAGTTVTLTAKPDSGYRLARWEVVEGDVTITGNRFIMPAENVTVRAVFSPVVNIPDTHEIELIVGEGGEAKLSLTNASAGSTITVTATPDEGFELDYITVDGERIDGTTFTMPEHDVTVRVYFTDGSVDMPFVDVNSGDWFYEYVEYVYANGLMDGVSDTLFDPDGTMTRAMVWAILARVDGETVTGANWTETAREWAMAEGVSDGENASGYVTREQLATMLYRYAVYKGYDVSIGEDTNILSYADFADLSEYAIPAMQWACGAGIITGVTDATLVPHGTATRAQCAAMLMRFLEANS